MTKHTSIIFCHGIGSPRQYLSAANFIDALDEQGNREDPSELGYIREISGKIEVSSRDNESFRNYIEFTRFQNIGKRPRSIKQYRVHEAYWAGDQHKNSSLFGVLIWVLKIVLAFTLTFASRWRKYPTQKRRILNKMKISGDLRRKIEKIYSEFDNGVGRKSFPNGSFREFQDHISEKSSVQDRLELKKLAAAWRKEVLKSNISALLKTVMVSVPILAFLFFIYIFFFFVSSKIVGGAEFEFVSTVEASHFAALIATLLATLMGWFISKRLISDVMAWTTMHESHESFLTRERRVNLAKDLLQDVLADPNCVRCVLVGHSLGSAIILDAFLRLNSYCRATNILESRRDKSIREVRKVSHIFTIGSPIQKIESLFYADSGEHHRYHRVRYSNPYLLDRPAWGEHGGPRIVNLWSRYDPVSSEINSLLQVGVPNSVEDDIIGVKNIEVAPVGAPLPLSTHSGYFKDPSSMAVIYQAIASGKLSEARMQRAEFKSSISRWEKSILAALFVLSLAFAGLWMSGSIIDGWLAVTITFMVLISLCATFATVRRDYRRHRGDA
ncbi:hypothetical protein [Roseicitreum antarcticum]|uniref:Uncharacterized protein n=1 Tax=Roseicitreum antarcticum TaxID=564137 RepID=A0A1H2WFV4_9RHOB|nr:hypothetical protein [Roseicitreum antarcticum]SDW78899.1 hypothetical protein SAMN04488238_103355 [Roseicitreum antarcticum]